MGKQQPESMSGPVTSSRPAVICGSTGSSETADTPKSPWTKPLAHSSILHPERTVEALAGDGARAATVASPACRAWPVRGRPAGPRERDEHEDRRDEQADREDHEPAGDVDGHEGDAARTAAGAPSPSRSMNSRRGVPSSPRMRRREPKLSRYRRDPTNSQTGPRQTTLVRPPRVVDSPS